MRNFRRANYNNAEQILKRTICQWIELHGGYVRMYPSFRGTARKDGTYTTYRSRYMPKGVLDLFVCWHGRAYFIEVKRPEDKQMKMLGAKEQRKGKLSEEQKMEIEAIKRAFGVPIVAYSLEDVIRVLKPELLNQGNNEST